MRRWILAGVLLAACSTQERPTEEPHDEPRFAPPSMTFRPMMVMELPDLDERKAPGAQLTALSMRGTPVPDALLAMFKDSSINLFVDPGVVGEATFDVKGTTVEHAFEALLRSQDLAYSWDGEFLHVAPHESRIFNVDLITATSQSSGEASGGSGGSGSASPGSGASGGGHDAWSVLANDLGQIVASRGTVIVNKMAGTIEVTASPAAVRHAGEYLDHLVARLTNQVSIEARVIEVRLNDQYRLGVSWALFPGLFDSGRTGLAGAGSVVSQQLASGGTALTIGLLNRNDWSFLVDMLQQQGQVRVLSSPRVSTMNNVPATIKVVDQIPIIEREVVDSNNVSRTDYQVRFEEAGVTLLVTPQIGDDGMITIAVNPKVSEQTGEVVTPDGVQVQPIISKRESTTVVRVPDGQPVVIGGLRSTRKIETASGVPLLQDIPILGHAFRTTRHDRQEVELVIMLVPRRLDSTWFSEERRRSMERLTTARRRFVWSPLDLDERPSETNWNEGLLSGPPTAGDRPPARVQPARERPQSAASRPAGVTREGLADRVLDRAVQAHARGQDAQCLRWLEEAMRLDPGRASVRVIAGVLRFRMGQIDESRRLLDQAVATAPGSGLALSARAVVEASLGNPDHCLRLLEAARLRDPGSPGIANNLAAALLLVGRQAQARDMLRELVGAPGALPEMHANLAYAYVLAGDNAAAARSLAVATALGADPGDARITALRAMIRR